MCYSAAPSTTNQNATQGIYIKGIKWLGKSLQAYSIKMQYEIVFKDDRLFMLYLPSSYCSCCSNCSEDGCSGYWYWDSSDGSTSTHEHMAKNKAQHKHTCKQEHKLRNSTTIHENNKQNYARTILRVTTMLKRSQNAKTRPKTSSRGLTIRKTEFMGVFCKNRGPKHKN